MNSRLLAESKLQLSLPPDIRDIFKLFKRNRKKLYVVGGAVRDAILGKRPKDFDLATDATPDEIIAMAEKAGYTVAPVGKQFGVVLVNGHEIATFRKDIGKGRRPDAVEYTTIEGDVKRRDLTINALFYDMEREEIVDLVGGIADLKSKQIRTVGNAERRFDEDPLRKLRAIRFAAAMNGRLDGNTRSALVADPTLDTVSAERIRDEFLKGIKKAQKVSDYLQLAYDTGLLSNIFPGKTFTKPFINDKRPEVVIAYLLPNNNPSKIEKYLNKLTYSAEEVRNISFLQRLQNFDRNTRIIPLKRLHGHTTLTDNDIIRFGTYVGQNFNKFISFELSVTGQELMDKGLKGREIGQEMERLEKLNYLNEARFDIRPGFQFIAKKAYHKLNKHARYVVKDIKGKIGNLKVIVQNITDGRKSKPLTIHVRSLPEFYSNVIGESIIQENNYRHCCWMLDCPSQKWKDLLSVISDADVYDNEAGEFGLEHEPHITILFGLKPDVPSTSFEKLTKVYAGPISFKITGISCFEKPEYDVLKFDVESDQLRTLNKFAKRFPHDEMYPDYNPHMTIGYLKPGAGYKYVRDFHKPMRLKSNKFSYSSPNSNTKRWKVG